MQKCLAGDVQNLVREIGIHPEIKVQCDRHDQRKVSRAQKGKKRRIYLGP